MKTLKHIGMYALLLLAVACSDDEIGGVGNQPKPVASVQVQPDTATLVINQTKQLAVVLKAADGSVITGRQVAWSVSDPLVAQIDAAGVITALRQGEVEITAMSETKSGHGRVRVLPVQPAVARIEVGPAEVVLYPGETRQMAVRLFAADNTELPAPPAGNVTWTSLDPEAATVDATGKVTALRAGAVWIRATFTNVSGQARISVPTWYEYRLANGDKKIREYLVHDLPMFDVYRVLVLREATMRLATNERSYEQRFVVETWERQVFNDGSSIVTKMGETVTDDSGSAGTIAGVGDFVFRSDRYGATFNGRKTSTSIETVQAVPGAVETFTLVFNRN